MVGRRCGHPQCLALVIDRAASTLRLYGERKLFKGKIMAFQRVLLATVFFVSCCDSPKLWADIVYTFSPPSADSRSESRNIDLDADGNYDFRPFSMLNWTNLREFFVSQPYLPGTTTRVGNGFLTNGYTGLAQIGRAHV